MSTNEKKGVTVKIDADLHAEVKRYIEEHQMTMGDFVALALQDELLPKLNIQEDKNMENIRTLAFQVPEELFQKNQGLPAAQQYDTETIRDRAD